MLLENISHYRILNHLGTSLIGEVYLAEDTQLGRKIALTLLPEGFTRTVERMQRLAQEARILSAINHPNIRMIYEVGQEKTYHFIATEFVEGPTLRVYLSYTRMRVEQVLDVTLQLLTGLGAAHAAGVLHGDLRPENIIIRPDGYVKILDFGLAKLAEHRSMMVDLNNSLKKTSDQSTDDVGNDPYQTKPLDSDVAANSEGRPIDRGEEKISSLRVTKELKWAPGAIGYIAPELIYGEPYDERSDIFSLGVVLYEMCTGRLPFVGNTTKSVLNSILQSSPPLIRRFMPEVPERLDWITNKALAKEPDDRYQTAREWLNDLKLLKRRLDFEAEQKRLAHRNADSGQRSGGSRIYDPSPISQKDSVRDSGRRKGWGTGVSRLDSSPTLSDVVDSIAVLPLANVSDDPGAEYLSDGITESIINALSHLPSLRVMARSTVFRYKGLQIDPLEVGRQLGVRAVFVGRLLQRGEMMVIKAELVDAIDGALIWADQYQRKSGDIFELEADIAKQISEHLRIRLTGEEQQNLVKRYTENPAAYDLYLKGRYFWNQRSPEAIKRGIECFVQAIKKDSHFAQGYTGLADSYTMLSWYAVPPREFVPKARISVSKALEIDEQLPEAHTSLGFITLWYDWDFIKAEREFLRAIELNPNFATAHQWYAYNLAVMERKDEAIERMRLALSLDPLSLAIITEMGELFYRQRRFDEALAQYQKALEMDAQFDLANYWRLRTWLETGRIRETIDALESLPMKEERQGNAVLLAVAYAKAGKHDEARKIHDELRNASTRFYVPPYYLAIIEANLGDKDQAFVWLEKSYQERSGWVPWLKQDPLADSLHSDPRFSDLLRKVGLKP